MSTQVTLNGKNQLVIAQTGEDTLLVPQIRCKYTLLGTIPVKTIDDYTEVIFYDLLLNEYRLEKIGSVLDKNGDKLKTTLDTINYLSTIINLSDTRQLAQNVSTATNQELMIWQLNKNLEKLLSLDDKANNLNDIIEQLDINNELLKGISS